MERNLPPAGLGTIGLCPHQGCNHTCCDFANGNYIALYPGELALVHATKQSVTHLDVTPDGAGGHRAICRACDKATCDNGYKPLDCASYPLFPTVDHQGNIEAAQKGAKCPLRTEDLAEHRSWVIARWSLLQNTVPGLIEWLCGVRLVAYERLPEPRVTYDIDSGGTS